MTGRNYQTLWRWHFYAGLFVLPFVLILSVTGAIYLFKPQVDRWEERAYLDLGTAGAVAPDRQLAAALAAAPGARFTHYRLPRQPGDAALIQVRLPGGAARQLFVSPQGRVLGSLDPDRRIEAVVSRIHGSLLAGRVGDWLVELVASWTIVMILTGLYLWWPRPFRAAGTLWPRRTLRGRALLKDIHRVIGFWIAGLVLVMLASGLPWAGAWGGALAWTRAELGWTKGAADWKIGAGAAHAGHDHAGGPVAPPPAIHAHRLPLSPFVARAAAEDMAFPVLILPPGAPQAFGGPTGDVWTIKSSPQNRRLARQVSYDPVTGRERSRSGFGDQHVIDRIVNTGVAWHEGQLFGLANQLIGLATAIALIAISLLGVSMWLKRRPRGARAPPAAAPIRGAWPVAALVLLCLLLPLFGASVLAILAVDRAMRPRRRRALA